MNWRKGVIGLFVIVFLVSGMAMAVVVMDEQKDLSSRASTWLVNDRQPVIDPLPVAVSASVWEEGDAYWMVVDKEKKIVVSRDGLTSVQLFYLTDPEVDLTTKLSSLTKVKDLSETKGAVVDGYRVKSGEYRFLNDLKQVEIWRREDGVSVLVIAPKDKLPRTQISTLISQFVPDKNQVLGESDSKDDFVRVATLSRPSVVRILAQLCGNVSVPDKAGMTLTMGKKYAYCNFAVGSGFFLTEDGYLGTNGHVVSSDGGIITIYGAVVSGQLKDLAADVISEVQKAKTGSYPDRALVASAVEEMYKSETGMLQLVAAYQLLLGSGYLTVTEDAGKYWVQLANKSLESAVSKEARTLVASEEVPEAKLVAKDYGQMTEAGFNGSDVAILKIEGDGYPALPLADEDEVSVGQSIQVIGFPGVGSGSDGILVDQSSVTQPTVTKGIVNALKEAKGDKKRLIQIDATINHGNSGGPAVDETGRVIGLATYGITPEEGTGNYNFLRDIADLKSLMAANNVVSSGSPTYQTWKQGLESYWLSYFRWAREDLGAVMASYPVHPTVDKYLNEAQDKVGTVEDKTPSFTRSQRKNYLMLSGVMMAFSVLAIVVLGAWDIAASHRKRSLQSNQVQTPEFKSQPVASASTAATVSSSGGMPSWPRPVTPPAAGGEKTSGW